MLKVSFLLVLISISYKKISCSHHKWYAKFIATDFKNEDSKLESDRESVSDFEMMKKAVDHT